MTDKANLAQSVPDALSHPLVAKAVATATTAAGVSTALGVIQIGVGVIASCLGAMLTYAILRKVRLETELNKRETELRIRETELRIDALTKAKE